MKMLTYTAAMILSVHAAPVSWDLVSAYPGRTGDTVIVSGSKILISKTLQIPTRSVLIIKADRGVEFVPGARIESHFKVESKRYSTSSKKILSNLFYVGRYNSNVQKTTLITRNHM